MSALASRRGSYLFFSMRCLWLSATSSQLRQGTHTQGKARSILSFTWSTSFAYGETASSSTTHTPYPIQICCVLLDHDGSFCLWSRGMCSVVPCLFIRLSPDHMCLFQLLTWGTDNAAPDTMKAVVTAIIPGFGALGSILACVQSSFPCPPRSSRVALS